MRTLITTAGVLVACALAFGSGYVVGRRTTPSSVKTPNEAEFRQAIAYYASIRTNSIPIPSSVDFRTNTIQQLAFWHGFALTYDYWMKHKWYQAVRTPGVFYGDPNWWEFIDRQKGWDMAETMFFFKEGFPKSIRNEDVPVWIATNYTRFYGEADSAFLRMNAVTNSRSSK